MNKEVLVFGDHHAYDGNHPWWTLRFQKSLTRSQKDTLEELRAEGGLFEHIEDEDWQMDNRQVQLDPGKPVLESKVEWNQFYDNVDMLFIKIDSQLPLFAIFLQEGQWVGPGKGKKLTELSDDELDNLIKE